MSFWRKEDPVLTEPNETGVRKIITGGMFAPQRDWWNLSNMIRLLVGGYGSGKTRTLCKWITASALHNAPAWSAIVSPNFPLAKRTVIPTIIDLLEGKCRMRSDMKFRHNKADHQFIISVECRPPATILYLSGDNPENLKGPNLGTAGIDEPFIQDRMVFDQMYARCRDPRARLHALGLSGTPEDLNWGYDIAEGPDKEKYDIGVVHADTRANLALPEGYATRLIESYDEKTAEAFISGKFVSLTTGRVFYSFNRDLNIWVDGTADHDAAIGGQHFVGMDFNVNPMSFVVGWHNGKRMHIYAEYELPNSDTEYACSVIREKFPKVRLVYPDPSGKARATNAPGGKSDFTYIERAGLIPLAPRAAWPLRDSYNAVNAKLAKGELTIGKDCPRLSRYLQDYSHEKKHRQASMSHLLDAMRYPVTYVYPLYRPSTVVSQMVGA